MKIDLSPKESKRRKNTWLNTALKLRGLFLGFIFFWLALAITGFFINHKIEASKKGLLKIEADWKNTEPLLKQRETLLKRQKELENFSLFLQESFKRNIFWSEKLSAFSYLVPDEVWLKELSLRKGGAAEAMTLDILAAVSYLKSDEELLDKINNFVETIKKDGIFFKDFRDVALLEINKATGPKTVSNIMDFKLSLSLKENK